MANVDTVINHREGILNFVVDCYQDKWFKYPLKQGVNDFWLDAKG